MVAAREAPEREILILNEADEVIGQSKVRPTRIPGRGLEFDVEMKDGSTLTVQIPSRPRRPGEGPPGGYAAAARTLGTSEGAVKVAVHRLRKAFRAELRAAIAETVSDPADVDEELKYLERALRM